MTARLSGGSSVAAVMSRYLAGCDGANSTVRELSGTGWSGGSYRSEFLADVELRGPALPRRQRWSSARLDRRYVLPNCSICWATLDGQ